MQSASPVDEAWKGGVQGTVVESCATVNSDMEFGN